MIDPEVLYSLCIEECKTLEPHMHVLSTIPYIIEKRSVPIVKKIITMGTEVIVSVWNFYVGKSKFEPIEKRLELLKKADEKLVFTKFDPENLKSNRLPRINKLATNCTQLEAVLFNLYVSSSNTIRVLNGEDPKAIQAELLRLVKKYEEAYEKTKGRVEATYEARLRRKYGISEDYKFRALLTYGYEILAEPLNIKDYLDMYEGGLCLEVKEKRILGDGKNICKKHNENIRKGVKITPFAVRYEFIDVIPNLNERLAKLEESLTYVI